MTEEQIEKLSLAMAVTLGTIAGICYYTGHRTAAAVFGVLCASQLVWHFAT